MKETKVANYTNTDTVTRTWVNVQNEDGTTLELEPGKSVDLDTCTLLQPIKNEAGEMEWKMVAFPKDFADTWLKPASAMADSSKRRGGKRAKDPVVPDPVEDPPAEKDPVVEQEQPADA